MSDEKKLTPGQYNDIIRHFVDGTSPPAPKKAKVDDTPFCYHNFVNYQGLNKSYEFCTVCDQKKDTAIELNKDPWTHDDDGSF